MCAMSAAAKVEHSLSLILAWISNYIHYEVLGEITVALLKFGNGQVISSHSLQDMWLFIHAGIKVNPC